jgi:hypothetical protein
MLDGRQAILGDEWGEFIVDGIVEGHVGLGFF